MLKGGWRRTRRASAWSCTSRSTRRGLAGIDPRDVRRARPPDHCARVESNRRAGGRRRERPNDPTTDSTMPFTLAPDLASIVRPGVLWLDGRDGRRARAAAGRAACRSRSGRPHESAGGSGRRPDDVQARRSRSHQDASLVRGAAAPGAQGRPAAAHQLDGGRLQLVLARVPAAVRAVRRRAIEGDVELRLGRRGRVVSRHSQGRRARRRTASRWPIARAVRQSHVRLGADDGDDGDHARAVVVFAPQDVAESGCGEVLDAHRRSRMARVHRLRERPAGCALTWAGLQLRTWTLQAGPHLP